MAKVLSIYAAVMATVAVGLAGLAVGFAHESDRADRKPRHCLPSDYNHWGGWKRPCVWQHSMPMPVPGSPPALPTDPALPYVPEPGPGADEPSAPDKPYVPEPDPGTIEPSLPAPDKP